MLQLRNDLENLRQQHSAVSQRLVDDRAEIRQLTAQRSQLSHFVSLAKEEQHRGALQLETTRRELDVLREERSVLIKTTAEKRAVFEDLREV